MKKLIFSAAVLASAFFAASCQQEELAPAAEGNVVTFEVSIPEVVATKAGEGYQADGSNVNDLVYAVYSTTAETLEDALKGQLTFFYAVNETSGQSFNEEGKSVVSLELLNDQNYLILFWAQSNDAWVKTTGSNINLLNVTYPTSMSANNEHLEAFSGASFIKNVKGARKETVTLTRPFAQINLATTMPQAFSANLSQSEMTVAKAAESFNVATQLASGEKTVSFTAANVPVADFKTGYTYAGANYIFANGNVDVTYKIYTSHGNVENIVPAVPVEKNYRTNILGNLLTSETEYTVELDKKWADAEITIANTAEAAQAALDSAADGAIIKLEPGVNYGTLLIRPVEGQSNTITDCDYLVYRNEMLRKVEDLTIIGAPGATVDAIKVVSGYVENSGSTGYVVDIKNLVIDSVTFTDDYVNPPHSYSSPLFFDLSYINVDGLTVKNCQLIGDNANVNFVYFYGSGKPDNSTFETAAKNVIIENNTVDGIARLCELRQTENVTITGNTIKNTYLHGMLVAVDKGTYSGDVTITGNTADGIRDRFVRMAGAGDAAVVIADNTINNYKGADADYIKVTDGTNVTVKNNTLSSIGAVDANAAQSLLDNAVEGTTIQLQPSVNYGTLLIRPVEGQENTVTDCDYLVYRNEMLRKVEDLTIIGAPGATVDAIKVVSGYVENSGSTGYVVDIKNLVIDSVTFTDDYVNPKHSYSAPLFFDLTYINVNGLTVKNCELVGDNANVNFVYLYGSGKPDNSTFETAAKNITIENNTIDGIARLCELRQTENVTITGNTIKNTYLHGMLLTVDKGTYSGDVTITGNTADGIRNRFVRMAGAGNAAVVIADNTINNYKGADADYIKVTDGTNVTIENNVLGVSTTAELTSLVNNATEDIIIALTADLEGKISLTQNAGIDVTILGNGHKYTGGIHIWGNGAGDDRSMTIKDIDFDGTGLTVDEGCIYTTGSKDGKNSYACNVTIEDCTFTGAGVAAIRQNVAGEKDWTIRNCTVASDMHSLLQVSNTNKGDGDGLLVENCKVYSKNGANLNYTCYATFTGCEFDVQGYAVRVGVNGSNSTDTKVFNFTNCTLKSANDDGDAVVIIRQDAQHATLNFVNTTLDGDPKITGHENAKVYVNGVLQVANKVMHAESGLYYNGINQNHKSVFYVESAEDLRKAASYFTGQTHTNEANCVTIELLTNIDLAGQDWTPWDVMWITLNAHGHKISNLNSNLFGYAGAVKVNDLTLENVISSGNQVGTFAAGTEGSTFNNCILSGINKVTYVDAGKEDNGIGAISGITINSNNNVVIAAGSKVTLEYNDIISQNTAFSDYLNGYKHTTYAVNSGTITVNGTLEIGGISYAKEVAANGDIAVTLSANGTETTTRRGIIEYDNRIKSAKVEEGITVIGNRTFRQCKGLKTVSLPSSLTEIGPAVFQTCSMLNNVNIPASVTTIGEGAFAECTSLTSISIPEGITRLEKDVLRATGLTSIVIPASVNYIGTYAFRDCESLTEVKILSPEFTIEVNSFTNMAAPVPTMTIYVVNADMKAYLESKLTNYDKSYITVVVM